MLGTRVRNEQRIVELINDWQAAPRDHLLEKRGTQQRRFAINEDRIEALQVAEEFDPLDVGTHHLPGLGRVVARTVKHLVESLSFKRRVVNIDSPAAPTHFPKAQCSSAGPEHGHTDSE